MSIFLGDGSPDKSNLEILEMIRDTLINNWTETVPPAGNIKFNFDWNDDSNEFIVSILNSLNSQALFTLGSTAFVNNMLVEIHIFVKQLTEEHPSIAGNIEKEILRILMINSGSLGNGISYEIPLSFDHITNEDNTNVYWHSIAVMQLRFHRFVIP